MQFVLPSHALNGQGNTPVVQSPNNEAPTGLGRQYLRHLDGPCRSCLDHDSLSVWTFDRESKTKDASLSLFVVPDRCAVQCSAVHVPVLIHSRSYKYVRKCVCFLDPDARKLKRNKFPMWLANYSSPNERPGNRNRPAGNVSVLTT